MIAEPAYRTGSGTGSGTGCGSAAASPLVSRYFYWADNPDDGHGRRTEKHLGKKIGERT